MTSPTTETPSSHGTSMRLRHSHTSALKSAKLLCQVKTAVLLWADSDGVSLWQHAQVSLPWASLEVCIPCGLLSRSLTEVTGPAQSSSATAADRTEQGGPVSLFFVRKCSSLVPWLQDGGQPSEASSPPTSCFIRNDDIWVDEPVNTVPDPNITIPGHA